METASSILRESLTRCPNYRPGPTGYLLSRLCHRRNNLSFRSLHLTACSLHSVSDPAPAGPDSSCSWPGQARRARTPGSARRPWPWTASPRPATSGDCSPAPNVVVGSVHPVTQTGSLVVASGSRSQLPAYAGGRRPCDLDRRGPEGGTRPEHRAAPRRRPLPPAGKSPHPDRLRVPQRHQPPAHPQRRTPPRAQHHPAAPRSHRILRDATSTAYFWCHVPAGRPVSLPLLIKVCVLSRD